MAKIDQFGSMREQLIRQSLGSNKDHWCACGRSKQPKFDKCFMCKKDDDIAHAYQRGKAEGKLEQANIMTGIIKDALNSTRIAQLIRLCHPDKHDNSEMSNEITKWLLHLRNNL